jgi:XapX domain-containing protein
MIDMIAALQRLAKVRKRACHEGLSHTSPAPTFFVGVIYNLLSMRSLTPPLIALVRLLGILAGDQIILAAARIEDSQLAPPGKTRMRSRTAA